MSNILVNAKKSLGQNFHLRIAAESKQNRSNLKADAFGDEKWVINLFQKMYFSFLLKALLYILYIKKYLILTYKIFKKVYL